MATLVASANNGLFTTVTGLSVVFAVLILLWVVLEILNYFFQEPTTPAPERGEPTRAEVKQRREAEPSPAEARPQREPAPQQAVERTPDPEPAIEAPSPVSRQTTAAITAAVVDAVGYVPDHITIRSGRRHRPEKIAAVLAAVVATVGFVPEKLSIRTPTRLDGRKVAAIAAAAHVCDSATAKITGIDKAERR